MHTPGVWVAGRPADASSTPASALTTTGRGVWSPFSSLPACRPPPDLPRPLLVCFGSLLAGLFVLLGAGLGNQACLVVASCLHLLLVGLVAHHIVLLLGVGQDQRSSRNWGVHCLATASLLLLLCGLLALAGLAAGTLILLHLHRLRTSSPSPSPSPLPSPAGRDVDKAARLLQPRGQRSLPDLPVPTGQPSSPGLSLGARESSSFFPSTPEPTSYRSLLAAAPSVDSGRIASG
ncbi:unnamed protein product [Protopolystoma xenopodis]|uniref:Uncharacterized protein n=1 Tax=Protopolystoma xenopodis TaxID=117903 RepID=A0A3S5CKW3_9PLAT|nr:unnamed protein product [Protopolystoma xenopodis]